MTVIAELTLDILGTDQQMVARIFSPQIRADGACWICRFEIGEPMNYGLDATGECSMQALAHALKGLSATLYASDFYKKRELGLGGEFVGYLGIPAPKLFLDVAPYPF